MNSPVAAPLPKAVVIWAIVGFVFAGLYLLMAIRYMSSAPWIGFYALVVCVLIGLGSLFALNHQYSVARLLLYIGGFLGLPLGLVMVVAANHMGAVSRMPAVEVAPSSPVATLPEWELSEPMSLGARLTGIFLSPGATFADIVRKPGWLAPLLVLVASAVAFTELMLWKVGIDRIVRNAVEQSPRTAQMTAEQIEQAVAQGAKIAAIFAHLSGVLGTPVVLLIIAGLGLLIMNAIFGKELNFTTAFSVTCYASLPGILASLMGLAMIFLGDVERFNAQNPAPTNVGFFLNPLETAKPLYTLASSIDVLTIWFLILLGIGFSTATGRKVKSSSIFGCYAGLWILWVLIKLGFALMM